MKYILEGFKIIFSFGQIHRPDFLNKSDAESLAEDWQKICDDGRWKI